MGMEKGGREEEICLYPWNVSLCPDRYFVCTTATGLCLMSNLYLVLAT
jgi:hypothetical protein